MKIAFIYFSLLFCICLCSCNNENIQSGIPEISPDYFKDSEFSLSHLADDIEYIPLDSKVMIRYISSIEIMDSLIFLQSKKRVLVYNINGTFIRQIGKIGRGPEEYQNVSNFSLDSVNQYVYVNSSTKVFVYNYQGEFIQYFKKDQEYTITKIHYKDDKLFEFVSICNTNMFPQPYIWSISDTLGNVQFLKTNTSKGFTFKGISFIHSNLYYKFNNRLHYWNSYNDTIFELDGLSIKTKYLFKKDQYRLTPEIADISENIRGETKIYVPRSIFESEQFLFISYKQHKQYHLCLYDKNKKTFSKTTFPSIRNYGVLNDIDGGIAFSPNAYHKLANHEYLSKHINSLELIEHIQSEAFKNTKAKYPEKKKALIEFTNSLSENDNPVLMLVRLKK